MSVLELVINGEPRSIPGPATAETLLTHLGLDARMVVVELNREIIRRPRLGAVRLQSGDQIELVHFVGGG